ncbi:hypothetical protein M514_26128 [Trichuris suis]|uniref:Uncharacterized protein n=1 Tax=Trichuris suis TaxID=68888 RepID=A0A085MWY1_9BILA|nr:hypothetical protein M514_26128 [Trichuris suis]
MNEKLDKMTGQNSLLSTGTKGRPELSGCDVAYLQGNELYDVVDVFRREKQRAAQSDDPVADND